MDTNPAGSMLQMRVILVAALLGSITRAGGDQSSSPVLTGKVIVYTDSTGPN